MVRSKQDFWAGIFFLFFGILIFLLSRDLPAGSAGRMAQGYFPRLLAGGLCLVGLIVVIRALFVAGQDFPRLTVRPLLVIAGVVTFGLLLKPAGLIVSSLALIAVSSLGGREFSIGDVVRISVVLIPFVWFVFIWALGLPIPLWPEW